MGVVIGDITVEQEATVGAGVAVLSDVPAGATVAGNPARRIDADRAADETVADTEIESLAGVYGPECPVEPAD